MAKAKRPDKIKFDLCKPPATVIFGSLDNRRKSIYRDKLFAALQANSVIRIMADDAYMLMMFRTAAKKAGLKLVGGQEGEYLYLKPLETPEAMKSLLLLLREPRSPEELRAKKLELDLNGTLAQLRGEGVVHVVREKWVLTEKGMDLLAQ